MAYTNHNFLPAPFLFNLPGVYAIVNRNNHKIYIGSAAKTSKRWNAHRYDFFRNRQNPYLMRAFTKDPDAFYFELVEELPVADKARRLEREQFWMDFYKSYIPSLGYNLCPKAASCEGAKHGPEYSAMISARVKGSKWSEETKARVRLTLPPRPTGWHHSEQAKRNMSLARTGKGKWSASHRDKYNAFLQANPTYKKKPVEQLSMKGVPIRKFNSVEDAEAHLGIRGNIHSVCKGKRNHCLGFKWKYA